MRPCLHTNCLGFRLFFFKVHLTVAQYLSTWTVLQISLKTAQRIWIALKSLSAQGDCTYIQPESKNTQMKFGTGLNNWLQGYAFSKPRPHQSATHIGVLDKDRE